VLKRERGYVRVWRETRYLGVLMVAGRGIPKRAPDARYPNLVGLYPNTVGSSRTLSVHSRTSSGSTRT